MNLVTTGHLIKSYTKRLSFDDMSFSISGGKKIGLIGVNGIGKSTLLKIIADLEDAGSDSVARSRGPYIHYLPRAPEFTEGDTTFGSVMREDVGEAHYSSPDEMQATARSMLGKLGIAEYGALTSTLSGGQRKRMALVGILLGTADLLILDKPASRLDSDMANWLGEYPRAFRGALLMITHDRCFLDSVAGRIAEPGKGKPYNYQANYEGFLSLKVECMEMTETPKRKRQAILCNKIVQIQWGARARSTRRKTHIQCYEEPRDQKGPGYDRNVGLKSVASRLGKTTMEAKDLYKAYGDEILVKNSTYVFLESDRVGIINPNGNGKSTLMEMLASWVGPSSGIIQTGQTIKMGYFSQGGEAMGESLRMVDYVKNVVEYVKAKDGSISAGRMLRRFLSPSDMQRTIVGHLSGGERRELYLLRVLTEAPSVALLDEPTNDLDIQTLTILEDYLDTFPDIIIAVPHDRYPLDRVVNRVFAFEGQGKVSQYEGGSADYQVVQSVRRSRETGEQKGDRDGDSDGSRSGLPVSRNDWKQSAGGGKKRELSFKEQWEQETIEADIAGLERSIGDLEREVRKPAINYTGLNKLMEEESVRGAQPEERMERWMYLSELVEQIKTQK